MLLLQGGRSYEERLSQEEERLTYEKPSILEVTEGSNPIDRGDVFLATTESSRKMNWILNSSCSLHMCSVREYFDTYQRYEKVLSTWQTIHKVGLLWWEQYGFACLIGWCRQ